MLLLERHRCGGCFSLLGSADFVRERSTGPQTAKDAHTHTQKPFTYAHLCSSVDVDEKSGPFSIIPSAAMLCSLAHRALQPEHTCHYKSVTDYTPRESPEKGNSSRLPTWGEAEGQKGLKRAERASHHDARYYKSQMAALMPKICSVFICLCSRA